MDKTYTKYSMWNFDAFLGTLFDLLSRLQKILRYIKGKKVEHFFFKHNENKK
jgi:hypothetical protein